MDANIERYNTIVGSLSDIGKMSGDLIIPQYVDTEIDDYEGEYDINPDFTGTTLETKDKRLKENISVKPIQIESVSNLEGGRTVYIGGII